MDFEEPLPPLDKSYLAGHSKIPLDRIEYHPKADVSLIDDIELGILFIMARWSLPAFRSFEGITDVIHRLDPTGRLRFVVIDTDGSPSFYHHPTFRGYLHGYGEIAWIRGGQIESFSGFVSDISDIEYKTRALLATE